MHEDTDRLTVVADRRRDAKAVACGKDEFPAAAVNVASVGVPETELERRIAERAT